MRPYDADDLHSTIVLGTVVSPGVVTLSGHDRNKNWDIQKAKGSTGASTTLNGDDPAQFTASFYLVDDTNEIQDPGVQTQFDRWEEFQRLVESMTPNGGKPNALPIYHPDLARNRILEVTNGGVGGFKHDGKGGATVTVKFLEYKPPKKKAASKAGAKGNRTGVTTVDKPDPNAAAKLELAALLEEARKP